jgi:CheY-like chemotaxis protein
MRVTHVAPVNAARMMLQTSQRTAHLQGHGMGKLEELSVLVVEDHAFQRDVALRLLGQAGVRHVLEAADGAAALALLAAQPRTVDVVLVDLDLPRMDGIEFIGHIARDHLAHAVVVLTALDPSLLNTVQIMARASGLRVLGTLEKPLTTAKVQQALELFSHDEVKRHDDGDIEISEGLLAEALAHDAFVPWFQPQVSKASRWRRWRDGSTTAGRFRRFASSRSWNVPT